jgi:hypothetical protein
MSEEHLLRDTWLGLRRRLLARGLMPGATDSLSLRDPASGAMAWGTAEDALALVEPLAPATGARKEGAGGADGPDRVDGHLPAITLHRAVYAARQDVCAVLIGGGAFGRQLQAFGGWMPAVFDEQIRQLGHMGRPTEALARLPQALSKGGNVTLHAGRLIVLGMTPSRLALNAELFEKCAKAWVPAVAGGATVRPLPWLVRHVANGRLRKEQAQAREQVCQGRWPAETRGY